MAQSVAAKVAIVMGSDSDWPVMQACTDTLAQFAVPFEVRIASAHRSPTETTAYAQAAAKNGIEVVIAAAGMAAHLAGVIAAHTSLPVIGVPMASGSLQGIDALLATVQMPPGVPVATVGIGSAGAENAAVLAVQILALKDKALAEKLSEYKAQLARSVEQKSKELQQQINKKY